jgi:hypothetical protein
VTLRPCLRCSKPSPGPRCPPCQRIHRPPGWTTIARAVLRRDRYQCQLRYEGCKGTATDAAHIDPRKPGTADNLIASCHPCNSKDS